LPWTWQNYPEDVWDRASRIRLLILDIDGVLTDGPASISTPKGETLKVFHVRDGHGIKMAQRGGLGGGVGERAPVRRRVSPGPGAGHQAAFTRAFRDKVAILEELWRP